MMELLHCGYHMDNEIPRQVVVRAMFHNGKYIGYIVLSNSRYQIHDITVGHFGIGVTFIGRCIRTTTL